MEGQGDFATALDGGRAEANGQKEHSNRSWKFNSGKVTSATEISRKLVYISSAPFVLIHEATQMIGGDRPVRVPGPTLTVFGLPTALAAFLGLPTL
jgi:hypothetical protein